MVSSPGTTCGLETKRFCCLCTVEGLQPGPDYYTEILVPEFGFQILVTAAAANIPHHNFWHDAAPKKTCFHKGGLLNASMACWCGPQGASGTHHPVMQQVVAGVQ